MKDRDGSAVQWSADRLTALSAEQCFARRSKEAENGEENPGGEQPQNQRWRRKSSKKSERNKKTGLKKGKQKYY